MTGASNFNHGQLIVNRWTERPKRESNKGDLLFTCKGTVGEMAINSFERAHIARQIMAIRPTGDNYLPYLEIFLRSLVTSVKAAAKGIIPGIERATLLTALIPVPPLVEQRRIAERVSELMLLIDEYGKLEDEREALDAALPKRLRKSVLQMAIQGKLVAQDPADEPASVLLERIREERAKLIKEKKVKASKGGESVIYLGSDGRRYEKRSKGEPVCIDNEIPFDIPEGWEWARLTMIAGVLNGDRGKNYPAKSKLKDKGLPFVSALNIESGVVSLSQMKYLSREQFQTLKAGKLKRNDIVFCIRGSLGKFGIFPFDSGAIASSLVIVRIYDSELVTLPYLQLLFEAPITSQHIRKQNNGTAQPNLAANSFMDFVYPVPPVTEQKRIIEMVQCLDAITNR